MRRQWLSGWTACVSMKALIPIEVTQGTFFQIGARVTEDAPEPLSSLPCLAPLSSVPPSLFVAVHDSFPPFFLPL